VSTRAIDILRSDIVRTMRLLGITRLEELTPDHVELLPSRG
jgi:L-lactate dehydrogenase (cytochrome)